MGLSVAVVCSVYGDYDTVVAPPAGFDDAVLVTDRTHDVDGWRQVILPAGGRHPRLAAKLPKCRPELFTSCEASVWVDGNIRPTGGDLRGAAEKHLASGDVVAWEHPEDRSCLVEEAAYCHDWPKYVKYPLLEQAAHYVADGMPERWGLYACGLLARRHTSASSAFGVAWLQENDRWSIQDQLSFPYVAWKLGIRPVTWEADYASNPWVRWAGHTGLD